MGLRRNAIGLREVLFQSVAFMGPAGSVAFSLSLGAKYAGGALCLSVLLALLPCLSVAFSMGSMASHIPSAGAFFVFPARALHPIVGFLSAWAYMFFAGAAAGGIALLIGMQLRGMLEPASGAPTAVLWIACVLVPLVPVLVINIRGIRSSASAGTVLGFAELLVICVIALALIIQHRDSLSLEPFTLGAARAPGFEGSSGIVAGSVYATLAFGGFEGSLPLAEESRNPRVTMIRAMVIAILIGGSVYIFTTYAATISVGAANVASLGVTDDGSGWVPLAAGVWGPLGTVLVVALMSSLLANQNATFNALTRTWYSMARGGVLPSALARTHPRFGSPHVAALVQFAITLGIAGLAVPFDAETVFSVIATAMGALAVCVYMIANISCVVFFVRERPVRLRPLLHIGIPVLGVLALIPVLCASLGIGSSVLPFVEPLEGSAALAGPVIAIWMGLGLAFVIVLAWRRPERLAAAGAALAGNDSEPS